MSIPESIIAIGFTLFWPAYFGAEPCVGSKTAASVPMLPPGASPSPPIRPGREVGDDVAVEVRQHEHVVLLGPLDELHAEVVHDPVLELDVRVLLGDLAGDLQPEPVRELHDVRLVDARHLAAAEAPRVVEGELEDAARSLDGDRLDRDPRLVAQRPAVRADPLGQLVRLVGSDLVLDPRVEILGRLADDHDVDVLVARADAGIALAGAHLRVEVEALSQRDVDRAEAAADRRRDRPLERDAALPDRLENVLGKRVSAVLLHHVAARVLDVPVEVDAGRLEHAARRLGQLRAGAVAGDQGHSVSHRRRLYR